MLYFHPLFYNKCYILFTSKTPFYSTTSRRAPENTLIQWLNREKNDSEWIWFGMNRSEQRWKGKRNKKSGRSDTVRNDFFSDNFWLELQRGIRTPTWNFIIKISNGSKWPHKAWPTIALLEEFDDKNVFKHLH